MTTSNDTLPSDAAALSRREREKLQTRAALLDAARELFIENGFAATSLRQIGDKAGYSAATVYLHFKDKAELMREICRCDFGQFDQQFRACAGVACPVERIREAGRVYLRFAFDHPHHYRLMFMTPPPPGVKCEAPPEGWDESADDYGYTLLRHACRQAIEAGAVKAPFRDAELLAQTFWAGVHGVAALQIVKGGHPWIDWRGEQERVEAMLGALLHGLMEPAAVARGG